MVGVQLIALQMVKSPLILWIRFIWLRSFIMCIWYIMCIDALQMCTMCPTGANSSMSYRYTLCTTGATIKLEIPPLFPIK